MFFILSVHCGNHADYQKFVVTNLRKYYPDPDSFARSTWDIIEQFWNLDLSFTDTFMVDKYSKFSPAPRSPSCMQRFYLLSIDFKVTSITDWEPNLRSVLYTLFSAASIPTVRPASVLSMTFSIVYGILILIIFLNMSILSNKRRSKNLKRKALKLIPLKKLRLPNFFHSSKIHGFFWKNSRIPLCLLSLKRNSWMFLCRKNLSIQIR